MDIEPMRIRMREMAAEIDRLQSVIDEANAQEPVGIADFQYQRDGTAIVEISLSKQGSINPGDELFTRPIPTQQSPWLRVIDEALVVQHVGVVDDKDTYSEAKQKLNLLLCAQQSDAMDVSVTSMVQAALDELGPYATAFSENQWHRAMHAAKGAKPLPQGAQAEFVGVLTLKPSEPVNFTVMQALATLKTEVLGLESPVYAIQLIERIEAEQQSPVVEVPDGLRELIAACRQIGFPVVTEGMKYVIDDMQSALRRVQNSIGAPSPRVTEQDADAIVNSAVNFMYDTNSRHSIDYWLFEEGRALLDNLNGKTESVGGL